MGFSALAGAAIGVGSTIIRGGDTGDLLKGGLLGAASSAIGGSLFGGEAAAGGLESGLLSATEYGVIGELAGTAAADSAALAAAGGYGASAALANDFDYGGGFDTEWGSDGSLTGANRGFLENVFGGSGGGGGVFGNNTFNSALKLASPAMSIVSGISGMNQAEQLKKQALLAQRQANPWATSGGQGLASQQLMDLMANPGAVAENDPAYKLRIQGAQRATATQGQGSGAMAVAGANASTDWYNARLQQLGQLAGAPGNATGAAQLGLSGATAAADLASRGQASVGFGLNTLTGGQSAAAMPPAVREWFRSQGFAT